MKFIEPGYDILTDINYSNILQAIEAAGRTCYKSEDKITDDSSKEFVAMIINRGHLSVLEHQSISVRFVFDRGVSHEIVRHRLASFSQESTRFVNYARGKFDKEISVISPERHFKTAEAFIIWLEAVEFAEKAYMKLIELGETPQMARSVLPNSLKTEIVVTCNLREWRLIFSQRIAKVAHPQMREVMIPLFKELTDKLPIIFSDIIL